MRKSKLVGYAGFLDGKLDCWFGNCWAVFKKKKAARLRYTDVRKVTIEELQPTEH